MDSKPESKLYIESDISDSKLNFENTIKNLTDKLISCENDIKKIIENNMEEILFITNNISTLNNDIIYCRDMIQKIRNNISNNKDNLLLMKKIILYKRYKAVKERIIYIQYVYNLYNELLSIKKHNTPRKLEIISQLENYFKDNKLKCLYELQNRFNKTKLS
jgi:hypothetical protein